MVLGIFLRDVGLRFKPLSFAQILVPFVLLKRMTDGPSKYAGLAAVAVFLTGWFIVGNATVRMAVIGVGAFIIALAVAQTASRRGLVVGIAAAVCSALVAYHAFSFEKTGRANFHHWRARGGWSEPVTREESPAKFRQATNNTWALSLFLAMVSGGCFILYRKLENADDFP